MLAKAFRFPYPPVVAHLIPIRRCNLSCTYCNEYDKSSNPVPTELMLRRLDKLAELGTGDRHVERRRAAVASRPRRDHPADSANAA